jgi:hypothetical protein
MAYDAANRSLSPIFGHIWLDSTLIKTPGDIPLGYSGRGPVIDLLDDNGFIILNDKVAVDDSIAERSTAAWYLA